VCRGDKNSIITIIIMEIKEDNFDIQNIIEKEKLKKEYLRRLRLVFGYIIKCK
jgi:hypothetical protein